MKRIITLALMACLSISVFAQSKFAHVNYAELVHLAPEADAARSQIKYDGRISI